MMRPTTLLAVTALAASQVGATDCGQVIKDPGFDLWCGDHLCDWKVERGDAQRVATWHGGDDGVEMIGDDVLITQLAPVTSGDGTCIEFSMLTDIDLSADVRLGFDVFGDGTVDYEQQVPAAPWTPVRYLVRIAAPYQGIKFRLSKTGPGHAVLAEIAAKTHDPKDCPAEAVALPPRADGAWCTAAADCASGVCDGVPVPFGRQPVCGGCASDADCTGGTVCTLDDAVPYWLVPFHTCAPKGARTLGEICDEDAECATGVCNQTCSTCGASKGCTGGESCAAADSTYTAADGTKIYAPSTFECDPGQGRRAHGEVCFRDGDCASGACTGGAEVKTCIDIFGGGDGRSCTSDLDCPENGKLAHVPCVAVGLAGGTCQ